MLATITFDCVPTGIAMSILALGMLIGAVIGAYFAYNPKQ